MENGDRTVYESERTVYDSEGTVFDTRGMVIDGTVSDGITKYDDGESASEAEETASIEKGRTLIDTYHVECDPIEGGMGKVWRVHHNSWNVDLAMKQPKANYFQTEKQKDNFIRECESWINLGLHPHIVSCYYVREIGGIPTIFSEWMDGGSLKNIIKDGSLYTGSEDEQQERILDIAIQFARGLHYAHEQGLIHQDVKPDNLLLNKNGEAKVADFGIAKARAELTVLDKGAPSDRTMFSQSGGYTPAYCSIEQMNGEKLTRRTDIYSWAVSVMEMYLGDQLWENGVIAGAACETYFSDARVAVPEDMKVLLRECLNADEAKRPHDFAEVEKILLGVYKNEIGKEYFRISPKAAADTADSLNNQALSYIDLGKYEEAGKCWEKALALNPNHSDAVSNYTLYLWRGGTIDDVEALRRMEVLNQNKGTWQSEYNIAKLHMERGDTESAVKIMTDVLEKSGGDAEVRHALELASNSGTGWEATCLSEYYIYAKSKAFSPDGKKVIAWGVDNYTFNLCDHKTGEVLQTFTGHRNQIITACFSPDGNYVLSGSRDTKLKLWDIITGQCIRTFTGHEEPVKSLCFSSDGKYILSGSEGTTLRLWNAGSGQCLNTIRGHSPVGLQDFIYSVCFSPDGKLALSCSSDKTLKLWDTKTGECVRIFTGHSEDVMSACFSPDGNYALSGSSDKTMRLWDIRTGQCLRIFSKDALGIRYVCFSPDGNWAVSASNTTMKLWDVKSGKCLYTLPEQVYNVKSVYFYHDRRAVMIATESYDYLVKIPEFDYKKDWVLSRFSNSYESQQNEMKFNTAIQMAEAALAQKDIAKALCSLRQAAVIPGFSAMPALRQMNFNIGRFCRAKGIRFWGLEDRFECYAGNVNIMSLCPDGKYLVTVDNDIHGNVMRVWNVKTGEQLHEMFGHIFKINSVCFSPDGNYILSGSKDQTLKLWDVKTGECLYTFTGHSDHVWFVCFSPDGNYALSCSLDEMLKLWDIKTGKCLSTFTVKIELTSKPICFSPDGLYVISQNHLHNVKTGEYKCTFKGDLYEVCISPDGKYVLSGGDEALKLWDTSTGECLYTFPERITYYNSLSISPDGNYALSCGGNTLLLWDMKTQECLRTFTADHPIRTVQFSHDGGYAIAGCSDGTICFWKLDYEYEFPGWADWDEGARPYLEIFLTLHSNYTDMDFENLISDLQNRGYGWLQPEGIRAKLEEMKSGKNTRQMNTGQKKTGFFGLFSKSKR